MSEEVTSVPVLAIDPLKDSVQLLGNALDKACKGGQFTIHEAYLLKIACDNLDKTVSTLDTYQKIVMKLNKNSVTEDNESQ